MVLSERNKSALVSTYKTILNGQSISYVVKRSSRAKHVRLEIRARTGLTVVISEYYKAEELPNVLKKKEQWILDKLAEYGKGRVPSSNKELRNGDSVPFLGRHLKVTVRHNPGKPAGIKLEKNRLMVNLNSQNHPLHLVVEWWYRQEAERTIRKRADELCPQLGVNYGRLTIRVAKTRWGSCSRKGNINFNWKLMMVPEPVIDYVIIHELAHLREMNHSKNFWKLVAEHCPQWRRHRKWLKDNEAEISVSMPGK